MGKKTKRHHVRDEIILGKVAKRIRKIREKAGITQESVAYDTNLHMSRIESGKANITLSTLSTLCKYFKISIQDFFKDI